MAQSVDTKIVELKFNNDNFSEKVNSTLTKLEQLNDQIKEVGVSDAFKNLSKSAKDMDMTHITKGVEEASKGFSKMEVAGLTALVNISNAAVNLGKKLVSNLVSPITKGVIQGGLARAKNIEQATFSFEGQKIGKSAGNEGLSYYKEVMDAVLGTSYSYDVAAKAASQFAASNVGVEKSVRKLADGTEQETKVLNKGMTTALLGVAGVAAMTGSSFEDIAHIFTKVAGQGRVMNDDLDSLATRGLNARAILGQQLGKTEDEIRDMAKNSEISFARIGADFFGGGLEAGRDILNSFTPVVDAVHNKIQGALDGSNFLMEKASKSLSQYLDLFAYLLEMYPKMDRSQMGDWIMDHMNSWTNIADLYKRGDISKAIKELQEYSKTWDGMQNKPGIDAYQMISDYLSLGTNVDLLRDKLHKTDAEIEEITKDGKLGAEDMHTLIDALVEDGTIGFNTMNKAFHKLWSESDDLMAIKGITTDFNYFVRSMIWAEEPTAEFNKHMQTFAAILNGSVSLFQSFKTILKGFGRIFLTLADHMRPLGKLLVDAAAKTATFVVHVADFIATSESFSKIIDGIVAVIKKLFELVDVSKLAEAALTGLSKVFDFLIKVVEGIQNGLAKVVGFVSDTFSKIVDRIKEVIYNTEELTAVLESVKKAGMVVALLNIIGMLTHPAQLLDHISDAFTNVGKSFSGMINNIGKVLNSIAGLFGKIGGVIDEVRNALQKLQEVLVATALLEIGLAIMVVAGALYMLTKIDPTRIDKITVAIIGIASAAGMLGFLGKMLSNLKSTRKAWEKAVNDITAMGKAFIMFAAAIAIMAAAVYALAKLDTDKLIISFAVIEVLLLTMAGIAKFLSGTTTQSTGLKALWSGEKQTTSMTKGLLGLVALAEAIKIVAKAIGQIATTTDPEAVWNAVAIVEVLMWSMAAIVKWLSATKPEKMTKGIGGLLAMALAIKLLVKPIVTLSELAGSNNDAMWSAVGAISVLALVMSLLIKMLSGTEGLIKAGASILVVAVALRILSDVVTAFASLDADAMWNAIAGIAVSLIAMAGALALIDENGVIAKVAAIYVMAQALTVLSDVIMTFGANNEQAWAGIGVAAIALIGLAGACAMFKHVPTTGILKLFMTLALGAVLVAGFGAAIGVFGVGLGVFGVGLSILAAAAKQAQEVGGTIIGIVAGFAIAIATLTSVGLPAIGVILALSAAFLLFGAGMMMIGTGMNDMAVAVKILTEMKDQLGDTTEKIIAFLTNLKGMTDEAKTIGESFSAISEPLEQIKESAGTITEQIEKLVKAYTELVEKSSGCITQLADSLTTISKLNQDSFSQASQAVKDFINSLADISKDAETVATTSASVSDSLEQMKGTFDLVVESIGKFKALSYQTFDDLANSLANISGPIVTLYNLRNSFEDISDKLNAFIDNLTKMKDSASSVSEGATAISDSLSEVSEAAGLVKTSFESLTEKIASILTEIGSGLEAMAKGVAEIVVHKDEIGPAGDAISSFFVKMSAVSAMADTIAGGTKAVAGAIKALGNAAKKTASLTASGMTDAGGEIVNGLITGMTGKQNDLTSKVSNMLSKVEIATRNRRSSWYSIGSYLIAGMVSGIASQQGALERQVEQLEEKARRAVEAKAKIHSPSKVWMKIGSYLGEGLAIGIKKSGEDVKRASVGLASTSENAIQSAIVSIADAVNDDFDLNPKITPVVDLTNVSRSAMLANSTLNSSIFGTRGNGLAASITHTIQNGGKSRMEKSIDDLTDQIGAMTDTMNSRSLNVYNTIDGSADPEAFADGLIRSFRLNARTV